MGHDDTVGPAVIVSCSKPPLGSAVEVTFPAPGELLRPKWIGSKVAQSKWYRTLVDNVILTHPDRILSTWDDYMASQSGAPLAAQAKSGEHARAVAAAACGAGLTPAALALGES